MTGIIYCARNKINGKVYVGQTRDDFARRKANHRRMSKDRKNHQAFYLAIRKYGWRKFEWSILEENPSNLDEAEKRWIDYFDAANTGGYNMTSGGQEGCFDGKAIVNNEGMAFISIQEAAKFCGGNASILSGYVGDEYRNYCGYNWKWKQDWNGRNWIPKVVGDGSGRMVKRSDGVIFSSVTEAAKWSGVSKSRIGQVIKNFPNSSANGYKFEYFCPN